MPESFTLGHWRFVFLKSVTGGRQENTLIGTGRTWGCRRWTAGSHGDSGEKTVSIVRVGLAETKKFSEGWDAIFGKKKPKAKQSDKPGKKQKKSSAKKK